ncbi:MAG: tripartite tricarboxylate transporter substrate binding protein [Burkholderiaceae bacterium]|jgi:tripartite-type tricarboxylate transporter receptor subunit TctC|nr:tripartite tricarboxylate transporter substrate binding protein [Burkholderiaceae bacterium]
MIQKTTSISRRNSLRCLAGAAAAVALPLRAQPTTAVRMILPFSAGGPTDAVARNITQSLSTQLGVPFVVENRTGANGAIASAYVAKAPADGNTLLYHTSAFTLEAALLKNLPYDPIKDFSYVGLTTSTPLVLLVRSDFPGRTPAEFISAMKANPGKFNYGAVIRSIVHVAPEQLFHALGVRAVAVPYKGTAPALVDLIGGQLQFAFDAVNSALPHIRGGRVRAIAVTSRDRLAVLPEVPTFAETVLPEFEAGTWGGIMAPSGTPEEKVARLNEALQATLADVALRGQFEAQGLRIIGGSPEQARNFVRDDIARWKRVAATTHVLTE